MKPSARKRRGNSRYFLFFVLSLLALGGIGTGIYYLLLNVPWFNVKTVRVAGNSYVADSLVQKITAHCVGQNLLSVDKDKISKDLHRFARIKSVKIQRRFFTTLRVLIEERKSALYVRSLEGDLFPVSEDGIVLEQFDRIYGENLPVATILLSSSSLKNGVRLNHESFNRVLSLHKQIVKEAPEFAPNISEYYTVDNLVYVIDARNGIRLIPGRENLAKQLSRYEFVQNNGNVAQNSVLDLRFNNQVVVRTGA